MLRLFLRQLTIVFLICVLALPSFGAISIVQAKPCHTNGTPSTTLTCQFDSAVTAGNMIRVCHGWYDFDQTVTGSVADDSGSNSYTSIVEADQGAFGGGTELAAEGSVAANVAGGTAWTITSTTTSATYQATLIYEISGLATASPQDQTGALAPNDSTTISVTASGANSQANEIVFLCLASTISLDIVPGTGYTEGQQAGTVGSNVFTLWDEYKTVSGVETSTADTSSPTSSNTGFVGLLATYKEAAAGGGFNPPRRTVQQ